MSKGEFVRGMENWIKSFNLSRPETLSGTNGAPQDDPPPHIFGRQTQEQEQIYNALLNDQAQDDDDDSEETQPTKGRIIFQAVAYLVVGAAIAGIMANPLVDAIGNFSKQFGVSPFFISFVATLLATSSSEAISSLSFAFKKKKRDISVTYSQIYGGVTMNNTMCLAIFLVVVYYRGLTWDFSSEVLVILIATMVIGILASVRVTFRLWMALIALVVYPISIAMVAVLDSVYGWQ